jgi:hypothetical protein
MHDLGAQFEKVILDATQASSLQIEEVIQELWSGYGQILRVRVEGGDRRTVVVKHVRFPNASNHPRGWNSNLSHERKARSYRVETAWYRDWSARCHGGCRVPNFLAYDTHGEDVLMVLEDLDEAGFPARLGRVEWRQVEICLAWLAEFHATFMAVRPDGLWEVGTYWHLDTRAEELEVLDDLELKGAAQEIDARLSGANYQSLVHGDAKLANFCFSRDGTRVAAVDFQYVGGGCGMKDVAYFVGSCLDEQSSEEMETRLLECYFVALRTALQTRRTELDAEAIITEWRALYAVAWTDFHRFLKGWSPGHWKINGYSERLAKRVLASLKGGAGK